MVTSVPFVNVKVSCEVGEHKKTHFLRLRVLWEATLSTVCSRCSALAAVLAKKAVSLV